MNRYRQETLLACAMLAVVAAPAGAAWVGVCPGSGEHAGTRILERLTMASGEALFVIAAESKPDSCTVTELPFASKNLLWGRLVGRNEAPALSRGALLSTPPGDAPYSPPQEIISLQAVEPPASAPPLGTDLIPELSATVFGAEDRAAVRQHAEGLTLECASGTRTAGMLLRSRRSAPLPAGAALSVDLQVHAEDRFTFGAADAKHERLGEPLAMGTLMPASTAPSFALPAELDAANWRFWVVGCPAVAARLHIRTLQLQPRTAAVAPLRSAWIWKPEAWLERPDETLKLLSGIGADTAFISVPLNASGQVSAPDALSRFITAATRQGKRIWAVAGDPRAVLPSERKAYIDRARAYAAYNRSVQLEARLSGLQLDIEPYLNPAYMIETEAWLAAYLDTISAIRAHAEVPIDVALPFWWSRLEFRGKLFLDQLAPHIEFVTIMNSNTANQRLMDAAMPFLEWSTRARKTVRVGLEAGPIPDESLHAFRPGNSGRLWIVPMERHTLVLMLDSPQANPSGTALTYSDSRQRPGSMTTFHRNLDALHRLLPELERAWQAWPSFGGIALHGFEPD